MMGLNVIALSITMLFTAITYTEGAKLEHMDLRQEDLKGCTLSAMDKCYGTIPPDGSAPNTLVEEIGQVDGPQKCQAFCKDLYSSTCTWFMYDRTTNDCKLFSGSLDDLRADCNEIGYPREPSYDSCDVVFSGDDGCYNFREDYCRFEFGLLDNLDDIETVAECQSACQFIQGCNYFMYDQPSKTCKLNTNVTSSRTCDILHGTPEPDLQTCMDEGKLDWTSESEGSGDSSQSVANPTNPPPGPTTTTTMTPPTVFDGLQRSKLTHGYWDGTDLTYKGPSCGSGEEVFKLEKTNPNSESGYLDTCYFHMPKQFLVYDFEEAVTLSKYSWSTQDGECPSSWKVYGANIYPDDDTEMFLVDTESGHSCQANDQMIEFEMDDASEKYRYYIWKMSEQDKGNGNNDGYRWGTIQFFIAQE